MLAWAAQLVWHDDSGRADYRGMKKNLPTACPAAFAHAQYAQFEEYWVEVIGKALRKARPTS
jgi:hypothetical protein